MAIALRVFVPFASIYLLAYVLRVVNAVAGEPISVELGLSAADLGFLTSVYLAGFALCQLPFGILMDRYGPRKVEAATLLLAVAGCAVFAVAQGFAGLVVGRVLMGVGASMCLMAPFTAYRKWFTPEKLPLVVGLHMACGGLGSALGGLPTEVLMAAVGWRGLFAILAGLVFLGAAAILFVVPAKREPAEIQSFGLMTRELAAVLKSRALWRVAPLAATTQAGFLGVIGLWTGPWLRDVAQLSPAVAAAWLSAAAVGLIVGFFGYGVLASRAERSGRAMDVFVWGTVLFAGVAVAIIVLPPAVGTPLWILYAALGSGGVLTYAILTRAFSEGLAGRVNTTLNFLVFFFAFLTQWAFGVVLEFFPSLTGTGAGSRTGYQVAMVLLLVVQGLSYLPLLLRPAPAAGAPVKST
ncbi:MAG: MFS transporter [Pseudomonadota bacterium]